MGSEQALKILKDDVYCDIIKISGITKSNVRGSARCLSILG